MASKRDALQSEAFRLWLEEKRSLREIAAQLTISKDTAKKYIDAELADTWNEATDDQRRVWVAESISEKDTIWRGARQAFDSTNDSSLNRGSFLNTMLASSVAKDKVRGLQSERHELTGKDGAPLFDLDKEIVIVYARPDGQKDDPPANP